MAPGRPLPGDWILALDPVERGAAEALALLTSLGGPARVLLTGRGLDWLAEEGAWAALRGLSREVHLCSGSARDRRLSAADTPPGAVWSSLARWMAELGGRPFGTLLP